MKRTIRIALIAGGLASLAAAYGVRPPAANAQRTGTGSSWEYRVRMLSYNPGERPTDDRRRAPYERTINEEAREGWELDGSVLNRDQVQTVGCAITTRKSISFQPVSLDRRYL